MNTRTLRIERTGDSFYGKITPKIRLTGQWLERAGFKPGHRVEVRIDQPGSLTLRFLDQSNPQADESHT
jgi:Toxin SymE, type I toxin-antitoxin system